MIWYVLPTLYLMVASGGFAVAFVTLALDFEVQRPLLKIVVMSLMVGALWLPLLVVLLIEWVMESLL